ncbi:ice-binding family protein [Streptosporangium sp. NPDC002721]|uniref:ice-binding family protein n=1 Tax=Streptosporangium sp. NPDC002721 TaxID=3366188 RepID=UPI0036B4F0C6
MKYGNRSHGAARKVLRSGLAGILTTLITMGAVAAPRAANAAAPVPLGTAANFTALAWDALGSVGATVITGDAGVWPGVAFGGFPPGVVTGTTHLTDAVAEQAQTDATAAYNDAAGRTPDATVAAQLGGTTLTPGVYDSTTGAFLVTGTLTLDGLGGPNAVFVLQSDTLDTSPASTVALVNGAAARNVFWQVGGLVNLGAGSTLAGNVLAIDTIELSNGASVDGRLLATTHGAVRLDTNAVAAPAPPDCAIATTATGLTSTCAGGSDGAPISFTATVTASDGSVPTGNVVFATDGATLGTAQLVNGVATLTTSPLPPGVYRVVAYYQGTAQLDPSNTPLLIQRVGLGCPCTPTSEVGRIRIRVDNETRSPASGQAGSQAGSQGGSQAGSQALAGAGSPASGNKVRTRIVFGRSV